VGWGGGREGSEPPPKDSNPPAAGREEPVRPDLGGAMLRVAGMPPTASAWMRQIPDVTRLTHHQPLAEAAYMESLKPRMIRPARSLCSLSRPAASSGMPRGRS